MSLQLYKEIRKEIDNHHYLFLASSVNGIPATSELPYVNDGFELYCYLPVAGRNARQISYNSRVSVIIDTAFRNRAKGIRVTGIAQAVKAKDEKDRIHPNFMRYFKQYRKYFQSPGSRLYKIVPTKIQYIDNTNIQGQQTLRFNENRPGSLRAILSKWGQWFRMWFNAIRAPFLTASLGSVILGAALAWYSQVKLNLFHLGLAVLGTLTAHVGTNMINDFFDHKSGNDDQNKYFNAFSGGSRMIQDGIFAPEKVMVAAYTAFLITIGIGLYLNFQLAGNTLLWIGLAGILLGYFYSAPPLRLGHRGIGELAVGLGFGMLITVGIFYVLTEKLTALPFLASGPAVILVFLILFINEFQDYLADKQVAKKTLVVRFQNKKRAIRLYQLLLGLAFLWVIPFVILQFFPVWTLLVFILIPLVIKAITLSNKEYPKIYELLPVNGLTIGIHFFTCVLLALGFLMGRLW